MLPSSQQLEALRQQLFQKEADEGLSTEELLEALDCGIISEQEYVKRALGVNDLSPEELAEMNEWLDKGMPDMPSEPF